MSEITSAAELRELLGTPMSLAANKDRFRLHELDRLWLAHSPFVLVGTSDPAGNCDVSPKGDPAGFVRVLDDHTISIPERPGNRRADGFLNILDNPHVGLNFFVPGRNDTLRINGRARLVRDAPYFEEMTVKGHRPVLAMEVDIDVLFYHCAKAFLRSALWKPETWDPTGLPSVAVRTKTLQAVEQTLEELETYYGPGYEDRIYQNVTSPGVTP
ncbi:MAG: pyridoxamine 5'-phosphate oxidase family protein [Streptosporangiaceae bacterium]